MPISEQSLRITDAYRDRVQALVESVQHRSELTWGDDRWLAATAAAVAGAQREAVRATGGYLAAYLSSELGRAAQVPSLNSLAYASKSRDGQPLDEALLSPLIGMASELKDGLDETTARANAVKRVKDLIDLAVKEAARKSLQDGMKDEPSVTGWRRAVRGTCDACVGAAEESTAPPGTPLEIHPNCQCVAEPVVSVRKPSDSLADRTFPEGVTDLKQLHAPGQYVGDPKSFDVNRYLRKGADAPLTIIDATEAQRIVTNLDGLMDTYGPIGSPTEVWRGFSGNLEQLGLGSPDSWVGKAFTDLGFGSTSEERYIALSGRGRSTESLMHLTVDPRVRAVWGANPGEKELLMERGVRYRIDMVSEPKVGEGKEATDLADKGVKWLIEATVLPPE